MYGLCADVHMYWMCVKWSNQSCSVLEGKAMVLKVLNSPVRLNRKVRQSHADYLYQTSTLEIGMPLLFYFMTFTYDFDVLTVNEGAGATSANPSIHLPHLLLVSLD